MVNEIGDCFDPTRKRGRVIQHAAASAGGGQVEPLSFFLVFSWGLHSLMPILGILSMTFQHPEKWVGISLHCEGPESPHGALICQPQFYYYREIC